MGLENLVSETFARLGAARPERVAEEDYRSFCDALGASVRGRAFLHEYARRNRHADTEVVLAALSRLEQTARAHQAEPEAERIRQDLRALLETLRGARPQIDSSPGAIKAATLAAMLEFVQARLEALISPRTVLEEVPVPEQPELPIPQPSAMPTVLALVQAAMAAPTVRAPSPFETVTPVKAKADANINVTALKPEPEAAAPPQQRSGEIIPEVSFFDSAAQASAPTPQAPPAARTAMPATEPVIPAAKADAPKPAVETYELWLDPGMAEPPKQEKAQEPELARSVEAQVEAQIEADLTVNLLAETPVTTVSPPKPAAAHPTTALAALAATLVMPAKAKPAPTAIKPQAVIHPASKPAQPTRSKSGDPLALIMALSEAERLALFT